MAGDKEERKSKKSRSKADKQKQKTSDELLSSLFNDLESTGQADDLVTLINGNKDLKRRIDKYALKDKDDSKKDSSKRKKTSGLEQEGDDGQSKSKSDSREKKAKKKKDKSEKKKRDRSEKKKKDKSKKKKTKTPADEDDKKSSKKKSRRDKSLSRHDRSPSNRRKSPRSFKRSRSPVKRGRSPSPSSSRVASNRSYTPPRDHYRPDTMAMHQRKWDSYRSSFKWNKGQSNHSRDNEGYFAWDRDRWSHERSRSWSPTRFQRDRNVRSPAPKEIDERRINKKELLELAKKNATRLAMEGRLPKGVELGATLKNKSVRELIELCEDIRLRDFELADPENLVVDKDDDYDKGDFSTAPVRSSSIKINLKDGSSRDPKSNLERMIEENALRKHFPVSYGTSHKDKTDKMGKEWVPVELETEPPDPKESVVTALSKKTVKIPTAYKTYQLPEGGVVIPPVQEEKPSFAFPIPFIPGVFPLFPPPFPMPSLGNHGYGGYEAPEIISAAFMAPPPPPTFSSFESPTIFDVISVPEPAPLTVVSNADLVAQAEEREREVAVEQVLQDAINKERETAVEIADKMPEEAAEEGDAPKKPSEGSELFMEYFASLSSKTMVTGEPESFEEMFKSSNVCIKSFDQSNDVPCLQIGRIDEIQTNEGGTTTTDKPSEEIGTPCEMSNEEAPTQEDIPMEIDNSPRDEGIASPSPPPAEFIMPVLPEGAVLDKPVAPISIGGLVSMRARLVLELNKDPDNHYKKMQIADIDLKLSLWAKHKNETTARFGAAQNMSQSFERPIINSIWATKDALRNAPEFKGGIGEHLLKRMGWAPGRGLGRNMDGPVEPLTLDVKADRKGLYSTKDKPPARREHAAVLNGNKNPVSAIMEYCAKKGIPPPLFVPTEEGAANMRRFGCKAVLNGIEYESAVGATNKKAAKAQVCLIMCQMVGIS